MRQDVREAIESARTVDLPLFATFGPRRTISFGRLRALVYAVVRELPEDMTIAELRDELDISENQRSGG